MIVVQIKPEVMDMEVRTTLAKLRGKLTLTFDQDLLLAKELFALVERIKDHPLDSGEPT